MQFSRTFSPALVAALFLYADTAFAAAGLEGVVSRINQFNGGLVALGAALSVTGFIWGCLAIAGKMGGAAGAITALIAGLCISNAVTIVGFFVGA